MRPHLGRSPPSSNLCTPVLKETTEQAEATTMALTPLVDKLETGIREARRSRPRLVASWDLLLRWRWLIAAAACIATGLIEGGRGAIGDYIWFTDAARKLTTPEWLNIFADERVQVGPVQIIFHGILELVSRIFRVKQYAVLAILVQLIVVLGVMRLVRLGSELAGREPSPGLELYCGAFLILSRMSWTAVAIQAPEGFLPLLWLWAALEARKGRDMRAALILMLAGGIKQWGLLGAPILLMLPEWRRVIRAGAVQIVGTSLIYAPFLLFGETNTYDFSWGTTGGTPMSLFFEPGTHYGWDVRVIQGGLAAVFGLGVALMARRSLHGIWLIPLSIVAVRLFLDAVQSGYYWTSGTMFALVGGALVASSFRSWAKVPVTAALAVAICPYLILESWPLATWVMATTLAVAIHESRSSGREALQPAPAVTAMPVP